MVANPQTSRRRNVANSRLRLGIFAAAGLGLTVAGLHSALNAGTGFHFGIAVLTGLGSFIAIRYGRMLALGVPAYYFDAQGIHIPGLLGERHWEWCDVEDFGYRTVHSRAFGLLQIFSGNRLFAKLKSGRQVMMPTPGMGHKLDSLKQLAAEMMYYRLQFIAAGGSDRGSRFSDFDSPDFAVSSQPPLASFSGLEPVAPPATEFGYHKTG